MRTENITTTDPDVLAGAICSPLRRVSPRLGLARGERTNGENADHIIAPVHLRADVQIVNNPVRPGSDHCALLAKRIFNCGKGLALDDPLTQGHVLNDESFERGGHG